MSAAKRRWRAASEKIRAKAIEIAGGDDYLALLIAKDLLKDTGKTLPSEVEAALSSLSGRTVRRHNAESRKTDVK